MQIPDDDGEDEYRQNPSVKNRQSTRQSGRYDSEYEWSPNTSRAVVDDDSQSQTSQDEDTLEGAKTGSKSRKKKPKNPKTIKNQKQATCGTEACCVLF